MDTKECREAFELAMAERQRRWAGDFLRNGDDTYVIRDIENAWIGWQAAWNRRARLAEPEGEPTFKPDWNNYRQGLADGRAQAIEDCARVCEERGYDMRNHDLVRMASHKCAAAIRNLDKTPDIKEQP